MIICPIVLPESAQQKNMKNILGKKNFFGPLLLLNKFRADLHMGEKRGMTNGGEKVFQICFTIHTECFLL